MRYNVAFLDVMVERRENKLITYVYRKPTYTGLYLKWTGNQPRRYKIKLIKCLCNRAKNICIPTVVRELLSSLIQTLKNCLFSPIDRVSFTLPFYAI